MHLALRHGPTPTVARYPAKGRRIINPSCLSQTHTLGQQHIHRCVGPQLTPCPCCSALPLPLPADGATVHLVPVVLKYGKRCNFGEHFAVVGSVPELGSWDPTKAVTMKVRQTARAPYKRHRCEGSRRLCRTP